LILRAPIFSSKRNGKFFCFGTQISAKFAGGSEAETKPNFQKKFELRGITAPFSNFPKFLRFFVRRFAKIARVFAVLRALRARTG
jgi:hypothetical protein